MSIDNLNLLMAEYKKAPHEYQATNYWHSYEKDILNTVQGMDFNELRSGKYSILGTFGFADTVYKYPPYLSLWKKIVLKFVHNYIIKDRDFLPYQTSIKDIQQIAYRHCELVAKMNGAKHLTEVEASTFGNPKDAFKMCGKTYTMSFLGYYLRYCFAQKYIRFKGDEIVVELGPGSGYQIEILKKIYPNITVLCFDLPAQIYLCEYYLSKALGEKEIVGTNTTLNWKDLSGLQKGKVHFLGNWQMPLIDNFPFDVFWNAASFGEMEPEIVENYLKYVKKNAAWIYLLQARQGKETQGKAYVKDPITFSTYQSFLSGYNLLEEQDVWQACKKLSQSGGYFEGLWGKEK